MTYDMTLENPTATPQKRNPFKLAGIFFIILAVVEYIRRNTVEMLGYYFIDTNFFKYSFDLEDYIEMNTPLIWVLLGVAAFVITAIALLKNKKRLLALGIMLFTVYVIAIGPVDCYGYISSSVFDILAEWHNYWGSLGEWANFPFLCTKLSVFIFKWISIISVGLMAAIACCNAMFIKMQPLLKTASSFAPIRQCSISAENLYRNKPVM